LLHIFAVLLMPHMLQIFRFSHPIAYLVLLVLSIVLRLPSFQSGFITEEENLLLNTVIRMSDGHALYSETLSSVSPLLAGIWYLFFSALGDNCLFAIRLFSCLYLFICAFIFNQLITDLRLSRDKSIFPGFAFLFGVNFPWYSQQMNGEMLILLPLLLSVYLIIRTFEEGVKPLQFLLMVGILTSLSVLLEYQSVLYYFGILLIYLIMRPPRLNEIVTLLIGFFLPVFFCAVILFFNGILQDWINNSLLYRLDEFINPQIAFIHLVAPGHKIESMLALLSIVFPLIGGFSAFRLGVLGLNIRQRKIESVMAIWMGVSVFMLLILGLFRHDNPLMIIIFPLVFYTWHFFMGKINKLIGFSLLILWFAYPIWSLSQYYFVRHESTFNQFPDFSNSNRNLQLHRMFFPDPEQKASILFIQNIAHSSKTTVWISGNSAGISPLFDIHPAADFVDFHLFCNKLSFLPQNQYRSLFSPEITLRDVYERFENEKPEFILDKGSVFPVLKDFLPILLSDYSLIQSKPLPIYRLEK